MTNEQILSEAHNCVQHWERYDKHKPGDGWGEPLDVRFARCIENYHDTLQSIGWFDGVVFTVPLNDKLRPLIDRAAEKYGCDGAELLEKMAVDCLADMSGDEMHESFVREVQ